MKKVLRKFSAIVLCCLFLRLPGITTFAQGQSVDNPGFEENLHYWDWKNATMERVTENPHSGIACAKVKLLKAAGRGRYAYNFLPDVTYEISIWVRLDSGNDTARIFLSQDELFGSKLSSTGSNVNVSTGWTKLTMNYTYRGDEDMGWTWISVNWGNGNTMPVHYLDDLSVTPLNAASEDTNEIEIKEGEIAKNCGLDKNIDGYTVKNATLSIVNENTYLKTPASGKVRVIADGGHVGQELSLKGGKSYLLSARVKTNGEILPFEFGIDFPKHKEIYPAAIHKNSQSSAGGKWTEISAVFTLADVTEELTANIYITAGGNKKGTIYYLDEFSVCEIGVQTSSDDKNHTGGTEAENDTQYTIRIDSGEFIKNGERIFLKNPIDDSGIEPMANARELAELLGLEFARNGAQISIGSGTDQIIIRSGSRLYTKNNISYPMVTAPMDGKNGIEVSVFVIAQCGGFVTEYNRAANTIKLTSGGKI